jgi:hypothetical protein
MLWTLLAVFFVDFNVITKLLIRYSTFIKYFKMCE